MTDPGAPATPLCVTQLSPPKAMAPRRPGPALAAAAADKTADFSAIYQTHCDFVQRNLRRLGVPSDSVEDAAQDVFLAIHRRMPDFEGRSTWRTWIFGFVLRVAHDHRRLRARKGGLEPLPPAIEDRSPGPLERLERSEELRLLDEVLAGLDEDRRAVFVMGELEQMTAPEIAEVLDIPINTVYSRLRLARRDIEQEIARRRAERRPAQSAHAPLFMVSLGKAAAAALLTGVLGFVAGLAVSRDTVPAPSLAVMTATASAPAAEPSAPSAPSAPTSLEVAPETPSADLPAPSLPATARPSALPSPRATGSARAATPFNDGGSLAAELALLREVRGALRDGDAARAERWIDEHAARYPSGALREERDAARVLVLCSRGRKAEARAEADRFLAANPRSLQADRVRGSCAFEK